MSKSVQLKADRFYYHYPAVATIVTSHADGRDNAMAVAWHTAISRDPPIYCVSLSSKRFTRELIKASGEFVVNFVPWDMRELVAKVAGCSGKDVDKFRAFAIAAEPGKEVTAPVLAGAYAAYECRLTEALTLGANDLFIGKVVAVHWDESAFARDEIADPEQTHPVLYLGGDHYAMATGNVPLDRTALAKAGVKTS